MTTLRRAFPSTVVIQYTNFPPKLLVALTDYEKEIGVGLGGKDVQSARRRSELTRRGLFVSTPSLRARCQWVAVQHDNYAPGLQRSAAP